MGLRFKVVETMTVTDESVECIINAETARGWSFEGVRFAMSEASRRPAMAFIFFTREETEKEMAEDEPR